MSVETPESRLIRETWERADAHYKPKIASLRAELVDEKQKVKNLEEYMLKGVAFRDELQAELASLKSRLERAGDVGRIHSIMRYTGVGIDSATAVSEFIERGK